MQNNQQIIKTNTKMIYFRTDRRIVGTTPKESRHIYERDHNSKLTWAQVAVLDFHYERYSVVFPVLF